MLQGKGRTGYIPEEITNGVRSSPRVMLLDDDDARWLIKEVNDAWVENYKDRVRRDIHKFSYTPDMQDESFGNNLSGVSIRYKILAMEQIRSNKESY